MSKSNQSEDDNNESSDSRPTLATKRLLLRPFQLSDAGAVETQVNDREIAANTRTIEYPYPSGEAGRWIKSHPSLWLKGQAANFAVCDLGSGVLMGAIGIDIDESNQNGELGYWIGRSFRKRGYTSEAALAVVEFGLQKLSLHKIFAHAMTRNPASSRVMEKIGMKREGLLKEHVRKWGVFEDIALYGILQNEVEVATQSQSDKEE
jgi:RimJ/RimL family protein N-acetyltransferase